jgi:hypothetical protein
MIIANIRVLVDLERHALLDPSLTIDRNELEVFVKYLAYLHVSLIKPVNMPSLNEIVGLWRTVSHNSLASYDGSSCLF